MGQPHINHSYFIELKCTYYQQSEVWAFVHEIVGGWIVSIVPRDIRYASTWNVILVKTNSLGLVDQGPQKWAICKQWLHLFFCWHDTQCPENIPTDDCHRQNRPCPFKTASVGTCVCVKLLLCLWWHTDGNIVWIVVKVKSIRPSITYKILLFWHLAFQVGKPEQGTDGLSSSRNN